MRLKVFYIFFIINFMFTIIFIYDYNTAFGVINDETSLYENNFYGILIEYPKDWQVIEQSLPNCGPVEFFCIEFRPFQNLTSLGDITRGAGVHFGITETPYPTLEQTVYFILQAVSHNNPYFKVFLSKSGNVNINDQPAMRIVYTNGFNSPVMSTILIMKNNYVYSLEYNLDLTSSSEYYSKGVNAMLNSYSIK